ncbi:hypothetical protein PoB_007693600 [Plakobranchus ocellatus]|uniref:Uncharacterized protein n=1 Tax=Plakobranchus ocellatus TaxID=259542 RepID=A0AAV4E327_9GAST|nr:hypothetical protein PoB_007693600 [Plakobranchus ocellatus]
MIVYASAGTVKQPTPACLPALAPGDPWPFPAGSPVHSGGSGPCYSSYPSPSPSSSAAATSRTNGNCPNTLTQQHLRAARTS